MKTNKKKYLIHFEGVPQTTFEVESSSEGKAFLKAVKLWHKQGKPWLIRVEEL